MEAKAVLARLGEPLDARVTGYQLHAISGKQVAWYAIETRWSRSDAPTVKKQRFSVIQEALLHVRDLRDHLRVSAPLPMLPLSILPGTAHSTCEQRATEFSAFLAAALAAPQLRITPPLLLLLAPDDTALEQPDEAAQAGSRAASATGVAETDSAASSHAHAAQPGAGDAPARGASMDASSAGHQRQSSTGVAAPPPVQRYPHRTNETVPVAPGEAVRRMHELLRQAERAVVALHEAVVERDEALRSKDAVIARLEGQLAELRAAAAE